MSRDRVLATIRASLGCSEPEDEERVAAVERRLAAPLRHLIPACASRPHSERVGQFTRSLREQSAAVIEAAAPGRIPEAIARYLGEAGLPLRLKLGADPFLAALPWQETPALERLQGPAGPGDAVALSSAGAGVAETGTLVLLSGRDNPTSLAFLPETHIIAVAEAAIVGALEDAFDLVRARLGQGAMPRSLNLVSGPSRTGDIGGRIVLGAHGPRRLAVIVYKTDEGAVGAP